MRLLPFGGSFAPVSFPVTVAGGLAANVAGAAKQKMTMRRGGAASLRDSTFCKVRARGRYPRDSGSPAIRPRTQGLIVGPAERLDGAPG